MEHTNAYKWAVLNALRSTGITVHGNLYFNEPLISEVAANLWVGGVLGGALLPDDFKTVFSLYDYERYALALGTVRVTDEFYDGDEVPENVDDIAKAVNMARKDGPVLVHCQAGLNRSALVAARALMFEGMTAHDAIALLREKRSPAVLCNKTFEAWLRDKDAPFGKIVEHASELT